MHGSGCDLVIRHGAEENFIPALYIENIKGTGIDDFTTKLKGKLAVFPYDSLSVEAVNENVLKINIQGKYRTTHEEHFGEVTSRFLEYLKEGALPEWEVAGTITKYFTTTSALKKARE